MVFIGKILVKFPLHFEKYVKFWGISPLLKKVRNIPAFSSFCAIFAPFTAFVAQKIKIFEKMKKMKNILVFIYV